MPIRAVGAAFGLAVGFAVSHADAASLTILLENVPNMKGQIRIGACTEATYLKSDCEYRASKAATVGAMRFEFRDVAPGVYGVMALHDENENGKLDLKFYGPPSEAYGASNNPPPRMGPARWKDVAFDVGAEDVVVSIKLLLAD